MASITSKVMTITPEVALEMLKANTRNRPMNRTQVVYYADQMARGQWQLNGEPIIFSDGNVLLDGQHRLAAIVKSQTTQDVLVVKGVDGNNFATIDTGRLRRAGDVFALNDIKDYTNVSAGIYSYIRLKNDYSLNSVDKIAIKVTNTDLLNEYNKYPELYNEINSLCKTCYRKVRLMKQSYMFGFSAYLILEKKHDKDRVFDFFKQLVSINPIENESISYLRDKLLQNLSGQYKMTPQLQKAIVVKCWNDYVRGVEHKRLTWTPNEPMPEFI